MILNTLVTNPALGVVFILAIALAISVHEAAHAWTAQRLGDPTAASLGRASLNPLVHLDLVGTLFLLLAGFGWGKPVPVNESRLNHHGDVILVALAGPAANLALAVALAVVYRLVGSVQPVLAIFIFLNLILMVFNLIPIPPLDGSKLLRLVVPAESYFWLERYGIFLLVFLFVFLRSDSFGLSESLQTAVGRLFTLLTGGHLF